MTDSYQGRPGEPSRGLPPYRPAGPQATTAPAATTPVPGVPTQGAPAPWQVDARPVAPPTTPGGGHAYPPAPAPAPAAAAGPGYGGQWPQPGQPGAAAPAYAPAPAVAAPPAAAPRPAPAAHRPVTRAGVGQERHEGDIEIDDVLRELVRLGGSDVHLTSGAPPMV
ncbi:MAG: hypothetical protein J7503_11610, partial [Cellulomonas iranensis]|nr:hypothetical protein [Cellulomonas iranensis]